jgi:hypothetical protein
VTEFGGGDGLFLLGGAAGKVGLGKGGVVVLERLALHCDVRLGYHVQLACVGLRLGRRDGGVGRNGPCVGAVAGFHEELVEGKLNRGADDVEGIGGRDGVADAFAVIHRVREGGCGIEERRGAKVGRKYGGEAKEGIMRARGDCGNGDVGVSAVVVDWVGVLVVVRIGMGVFLGGGRPGNGATSAGDIVLELG